MNIEKTDFIIVGSGVAGLRAAIELAVQGSDVIVLTKDGPLDSSSEHAQGGIAAALSDEDEVGLHYSDTIKTGDGLSIEEAVKIMVEEGPAYISELIDWGTEFDREGAKLSFTMEAAHSARRILHAHGDATGREIVRALLNKASTYPQIKFYSNTYTIDLVIDQERCVGLTCLDEESGEILLILTRGLLLATGGAGMVYLETTNPPQATGDGMAIAYLAGAEMMDMEFVQFHPTSLFLPDTSRFLLSESLRGEGAHLRNEEHKRFMEEYNPQKELAPRDIVSRSIIMELKKTGANKVYLDATHLEASYLRDRFPKIYNTCMRFNIDITKDLIPIHPSAHYFMGGVRTDTWGRTSLQNLYAAGEVACTGVHGANRLASNSLLEGLVYGARAGKTMISDLKTTRVPEKTEALPESVAFPEDQADNLMKRIRDTAWKNIGIIRDGKELMAMIDLLSSYDEKLNSTAVTRKGLQTRNIFIISKLIVESALKREESRGAHYRSDYPEKLDFEWKVHSILKKGKPNFSVVKA
jgi:L-aspartate oxidase